MVAELRRRAFLLRGLQTAAGLTAAGRLALPPAAGAAPPAAGTSAAPVALPSPAQVRADFQRMVDFGPRFTGTRAHAGFVDWLEEELAAAGCVMLPREQMPLTIWEAQRVALDIVDGFDRGSIPVSGYYPRSRETPESGLTGHLVYAGVAPVPALDTGLQGLAAAIGAYPRQLTSWVQSLVGALGADPRGAILLVDVPMPLPLPLAALLALSTSLHWSGHTLADWLAGDFKRTALAPGLTGVPLAPFKALGAAGVVFVLDASADAIRGGYMPFTNAFEDIPALFVDRDTGTRLRLAASQRPQARLTLTAKRRKGTTEALLGYLPGASGGDDAIFLDTHTDGEGFVEENGGVGLVHLARHFGSLPPDRRLRRSLVVSLWPGHMAPGMKGLQGIIDAHPDIVRSAVAGITVEHLGCSEWIDTADRGYHATGDPETMFVWTTQGKLTDLVREATVAADLPRTALMRPPAQFGVGSPLQSAGVPQVGFLAGPAYLINDAPGSDMDKLDEKLAARQIAWTADIVRRLDAVAPASLSGDDPSLGARAAGRKAKFPVLPAVELTLTLRANVAQLRRGRQLTGTVSLNRNGLVRVRAHVERPHGGKLVRTRLADGLLQVTDAAPVAFALAPSARGRAALGRPGARLVLTARFRERGNVATRQLTRRAG